MESICSYSDFYVQFLLPKFIEKKLKVGILEIPILHLMLEMLSSFLVKMQENALARFCGLRNCYSSTAKQYYSYNMSYSLLIFVLNVLMHPTLQSVKIFTIAFLDFGYSVQKCCLVICIAVCCIQFWTLIFSIDGKTDKHKLGWIGC